MTRLKALETASWLFLLIAVPTGVLAVLDNWRTVGLPYYGNGWGGIYYGMAIENFSPFYALAESAVILLLPIAGLAFLFKDRFPSLRNVISYTLAIAILGLTSCILTLLYFALSGADFYWGYGDLVGSPTFYIFGYLSNAIYPVSLGLFMILLLQGKFEKGPAQ
ncbi:MAG: hypothetical protein ABJK59_13405 [Erythrobacter sp.]|uniref:hypothetical protein n=1 Tax=Erythrobacter sp. TaxID=1042 RepID=UPI0032978110